MFQNHRKQRRTSTRLDHGYWLCSSLSYVDQPYSRSFNPSVWRKIFPSSFYVTATQKLLRLILQIGNVYPIFCQLILNMFNYFFDTYSYMNVHFIPVKANDTLSVIYTHTILFQ